MSDPITREVETVYGTATVETYECDSCGTEVPYDDTVQFIIDDRKGRACKHCADVGPTSFPERTWEFVRPEAPFDGGWFGNLMIALVTAPLSFVVFNITAFTDQGDKFEGGYLYATVTLLVWVIIPLALVIAL